MYEHRNQPLLAPAEFSRSVTRHFALALLIVTAALGVGVIGYHLLVSLNWIDSSLNASMILGGMGPVDPLSTNAAKMFASFYALFSGLFFIGIAPLIFAPFADRLLHRFHVEEK